MSQDLSLNIWNYKGGKLFDWDKGTHLGFFHHLLQKVLDAKIFGDAGLRFEYLGRRQSFLERRFKGGVCECLKLRIQYLFDFRTAKSFRFFLCIFDFRVRKTVFFLLYTINIFFFLFFWFFLNCWCLLLWFNRLFFILFFRLFVFPHRITELRFFIIIPGE